MPSTRAGSCDQEGFTMSKHQVCHAHCPSEGSSGAGVLAIGAVAVVLALAAIRAMWHVIVHVLIVAGIVAGSVVVLGAIAGGTVLLLRERHRDHAGYLPPARARGLVIHQVPRPLPPVHRPELAPAYHLHLHGLQPEEVARIMAGIPTGQAEESAP